MKRGLARIKVLEIKDIEGINRNSSVSVALNKNEKEYLLQQMARGFGKSTINYLILKLKQELKRRKNDK